MTRGSVGAVGFLALGIDRLWLCWIDRTPSQGKRIKNYIETLIE
jgi:hypothetical protein